MKRALFDLACELGVVRVTLHSHNAHGDPLIVVTHPVTGEQFWGHDPWGQRAEPRPSLAPKDEFHHATMSTPQPSPDILSDGRAVSSGSKMPCDGPKCVGAPKVWRTTDHRWLCARCMARAVNSGELGATWDAAVAAPTLAPERR